MAEAFEKNKERVIQEYVPGKQITLAHIILRPEEELCEKLGLLEVEGAIGIFTITPGEAAMIAGDIATKTSDVHIGFVDRFNGSLVVTGEVSSVESAMRSVMDVLCGRMGFASAEISRT